jgi:hypothetical protein
MEAGILILPTKIKKINSINVHPIIRLSIGLLLIFSAMNIILIDQPLVKNASAGSSWTQTTEADFIAGSKDKVTVTINGDVTLETQNISIQDNFNDESKISSKSNLTVNPIAGEIKLTKISKIFGGAGDDYGYSIEPTDDGGYIIIGNTRSYGGADSDVWMIKTNSTGVEEWNTTFGGTNNDYGYSVNQTKDGGFIIGGYTKSYGTSGSYDVWLIKTDSNGNKKWDKTFGGTANDYGYSVQQTKDDGFIIGGRTLSQGAGSYDVWLIKTNDTGAELWSRTYGNGSVDEGFSVQQTRDDGYIITGRTLSWGAGGYDVWLIKTNESGNESWNNTFGGIWDDEGNSVNETSDGGFIITGFTKSYGVDFTSDLWLIKTNKTGNETWNETFGDGNGFDEGFFVHETNDNGFIIAGYTNAFGAIMNNAWLIKTNSTGSEHWNKTFGGAEIDEGYAVVQTTDGGFTLTGYSKTYGTSGSYDVWLISTNETGCVKFTNGTLTSTNLLDGIKSSGIGDIKYDVTIPPLTDIQIQFSQNTTHWYNTTGGLGGWEPLSDGNNFAGLSLLNWNGSHLYYRLNFSSGETYSPILSSVIVIYHKYETSGSLESKSHDSGSDGVSWGAISWSASVPQNSDIKFQLRTATTGGGLTAKSYVGPGGSTILYYETSSSNIWTGHDTERFIQFKAFLNTSNSSLSPVLNDVTITFNAPPTEPIITNPPDDEWTNKSKPKFEWNFKDVDGTQSAFQVQIDNNIDFNSIEYNSNENTSTDSYWQFALGTSYNTITDGTWYWRVRTKDNDGDWGPYGQHRTIKIDSTKPNEFYPNANPKGWTSNKQPTISFLAIDDGSGMDHYELRIDDGNFNTRVSPYTLPVQTEGIHNITVRAHDVAGNFRDGYVNVNIDTSTPYKFNPTAEPDDWSTETQPVITFSTTDAISDIHHYEIKIDDGSYTPQTNPYTCPPQSDGQHNITVRAFDLAGNTLDSYVDIFVDTTPPNDFKPTADPATWSSNKQPTISFTTTDAGSGLDHFEVSINQGTFSSKTSPYKLPPQIDGIHNITVRAIDKVGKSIDRYVDVYIDTIEPKNYTKLSADTTGWTSNNKPTIEFSTTDATSGLDHYEVNVDDKSLGTKTSPYQFQNPLTDGIHNVTVKAYDKASNIREGDIKLSIDTTPPSITHTKVTNGTINEPILISAEITDIHSGIGEVTLYYKKPAATSDTYETISMVADKDTYSATIPKEDVTAGTMDYYLKAADQSSPPNTVYFGDFGTVPTAPDNLKDIDISITEIILTYLEISEKLPPDGARDQPVDIEIEITFSEPIDTVKVKSSFSIDPDVPGTGRIVGDDTLVWTFDMDLEYLTSYNITISTNAEGTSGHKLKEDVTWSFQTVDPPPEKEIQKEDELTDWSFWEPIITILALVASAVAFLIGFISIRRKRNKLRQYLVTIDNTFNDYKKNYQECEQELITLRDSIKHDVEDGKIEENHFLILDKKIEDYMHEMESEKKNRKNKRKKDKAKKKEKESEESEDWDDDEDYEEEEEEEPPKAVSESKTKSKSKSKSKSKQSGKSQKSKDKGISKASKSKVYGDHVIDWGDDDELGYKPKD